MKAGINAIIQKINEEAELHEQEKLAALAQKIDSDCERDIAAQTSDFERHRDILIRQKEHELSILLERKQHSLDREVLEYQRMLLDEIFDAAVLELRNIPKDQFISIFQSVTGGLSGEFDLILGQHSQGKLTKEDTANTGSNLKITLQDTLYQGKSGFILTNDNVEYNCFFEDLADHYKERRSAAIIKDVFTDAD